MRQLDKKNQIVLFFPGSDNKYIVLQKNKILQINSCSLGEKSTIQLYHFCTILQQTHANQSTQTDCIIQTSTTQDSLQSESNSITNSIGAEFQKTQTKCSQNITITPTVHNSNASFFNETRNMIQKRDCIKYTENDPSTKDSNSLVLNEALKTETRTFNYP